MFKTFSSMVTMANLAVACQQGNTTFLYTAAKLSPDSMGCVNTWELGNDQYLVVSPMPPIIAGPFSITSTPNTVQWLMRTDAKCALSTKSLRAGLESGMSVHDLSPTFSLVSFDPAVVAVEKADLAVVDCQRVAVNFRKAWVPPAADETVFRVEPKLILDDPIKEAFILSVGDPEGEYIELLSKLSGALPLPITGSPIPTRYSYSPQNQQAAQWIAEYLVDEGTLDDVYNQDFRMPNGNVVSNVVGVKYGSEKPDEIIVVGAHFDSISPTPSTAAPGAVDNGSGTVGVMMLAAALANMKLKRTVHFVAFNGEEQGLYGSAHYVNVAKAGGWKIGAALTMDMIAYSNQYFGVIIEGTTNSAIQALMQSVAANSKQYGGSGFTVVTSNNSFGSDHVSFQKAGYAAILAIERDDTNYPGYHRSTDQVSYADEAQSISIVKGLAGSLYDYAQA